MSAQAAPAAPKKKKHIVAKVILIVLAVAIVAAVVAVFAYKNDNLHYMDHALDATYEVGFTEKQATMQNGATINYAEGPDNGDPILLVHGQQVAWEDYYTVLPELSRTHHVYAIDCYGHGDSTHDALLYTCRQNGSDIIEFIETIIQEPVIISGHSSGGVLAAWVAANAPQDVTAAVLEDPPFFEVTPEEMTEGAGCWAWVDSFVNIHGYLNQNQEADWPVYYVEHSYLFSQFGELQPQIVDMIRTWRAEHPSGPVTLPWIPHSWMTTFYYNDFYDLYFGEAFYDGSWMEGVDQKSLLQNVKCPVVYLKANTHYGDDGMIYAANSDDDAALVQASIPTCTTIHIESGHDIHGEHPDDFIAAFSTAEAGDR